MRTPWHLANLLVICIISALIDIWAVFLQWRIPLCPTPPPQKKIHAFIYHILMFPKSFGISCHMILTVLYEVGRLRKSGAWIVLHRSYSRLLQSCCEAQILVSIIFFTMNPLTDELSYLFIHLCFGLKEIN